MKIKLIQLILVIVVLNNQSVSSLRKYSKEDINKLKEDVKDMFYHAYNGYLTYAYPYDELRPLSCDGIDTWGSYSLTLIDALDTLAIMQNYTEFNRVVKIITEKANFDVNINVSVFETNIRIVGGLLSAHLLSERTGLKLEPGWPCNGPLLRLAEDVAKRLLPAFDTDTGMPYGTVNLKYGVPTGETPVTCTAGVGTYIIEFGTLSRLTGDPIYEEVAMNALRSLFKRKSNIGLFGNHIDTKTGTWTAQDSGIGAGVDSYFEYLVKGAILFQNPELLQMFNEIRPAINRYLKRDDWYLWVSMYKGTVSLPIFQSLEAFWPGLLSLLGDVSTGMKSLHNYHQVWKQYGFLPEFYNIVNSEAGANRESYPLRPELIESVMYLYRATGDPYLLEVGEDMFKSIQHSAKTPCGYATIKNVIDHTQEDRMESFFLSETTKYFYLLFDSDNFIHNNGSTGRIFQTDAGQLCVLGTGGYIFNTEAHPIDLAALHCCSNEIIGVHDESEDLYMEQEDEILNQINVTSNSKEGVKTSDDTIEDIIEVENNKEKKVMKNISIEETENVNEIERESDFDEDDHIKFTIKTINLEDNEKHDNIKEENVPIKKTLKESNDAKMNDHEYEVTEDLREDVAVKKLGNDLEIDEKEDIEKLDNIRAELKEENTNLFSSLKLNKPLGLRREEIINKIQTNINKLRHNQKKIDKMFQQTLEYSSNNLEDIEIIEKFKEKLNDLYEEQKSVKLYNSQLDIKLKELRGRNRDEVLEKNDDEVLDSDKISVNSSIDDDEDGEGHNQTDSDETSDYCIAGSEDQICNPTSRDVFNSQKLFEKIKSSNSNKIEYLVKPSYSLLTCPPQPFFDKFSLRGQFFNVP